MTTITKALAWVGLALLSIFFFLLLLPLMAVATFLERLVRAEFLRLHAIVCRPLCDCDYVVMARLVTAIEKATRAAKKAAREGEE